MKRVQKPQVESLALRTLTYTHTHAQRNKKNENIKWNISNHKKNLYSNINKSNWRKKSTIVKTKNQNQNKNENENKIK